MAWPLRRNTYKISTSEVEVGIELMVQSSEIIAVKGGEH